MDTVTDPYIHTVVPITVFSLLERKDIEILNLRRVSWARVKVVVP
jgi:vacuolar-type H+-ATPase subunit C/Vma6